MEGNFGKFRTRRTLFGWALAWFVGMTILVLAIPSVAEADTLEEVVYATWPAEAADQAIGVAYEEGGGNNYAINPTSGACTTWQFLPSTAAGLGYSCDHLMADPYLASRVAAMLYAEQGFTPWVVYPAAPSSIAAGRSVEMGGSGAGNVAPRQSYPTRADRADRLEQRRQELRAERRSEYLAGVRADRRADRLAALRAERRAERQAGVRQHVSSERLSYETGAVSASTGDGYARATAGGATAYAGTEARQGCTAWSAWTETDDGRTVKWRTCYG